MKKIVKNVSLFVLMGFVLIMAGPLFGVGSKVYATNIVLEKETNKVFLKMSIFTLLSFLGGLSLGALIYYLNEEGKIKLNWIQKSKSGITRPFKQNKFNSFVGVLVGIGVLMMFFFFLMYFYYIPNSVGIFDNSNNLFLYEEEDNSEEDVYTAEFSEIDSSESKDAIDIDGFWSLKGSNYKGLYFSNGSFRLHNTQITYANGQYEVQDNEVILSFYDDLSDMRLFYEDRGEKGRRLCDKEGKCFYEDTSIDYDSVFGCSSYQVESSEMTGESLLEVNGDLIYQYRFDGETCELNAEKYIYDKLSKDGDYYNINAIEKVEGNFMVVFSYIFFDDGDRSGTGLMKLDLNSMEVDELVHYDYGNIFRLAYFTGAIDDEKDLIVYVNSYYNTPTPHVQDACGERDCDEVIEEMEERNRNIRESGDIGIFYYDLNEDKIVNVDQPFN